MTELEKHLLGLVASIDKILGVPEDGCNNPDQTISYLEEAVQKARKEYPNFEWVSVKDSLPTEDDREVAVKLADGSKEIAWATYWHGSSNDFAHWTFPFNDERPDVTHWMKLPN